MHLTDDDIYLFNEGNHRRIYHQLGAHPGVLDGADGTQFAVWAPNAERVSVIGDFNGWNPGSHWLQPRETSGIWQGFVPGAVQGAKYKYHIESRHNGYQVDKADPVGFWHEQAPRTASVIWRLDYQWNDRQWVSERGERNSLTAPISIYELHLGSWMRSPDDPHKPLGYRDLAPRLAKYVSDLGFTHVELMPVLEHPYYPSWGYQVTGYFAPTSRYGEPQDFMHFVDTLHQAGIGVILDWVPAHFPTDEHGLGYFDGTHLYEHADERKGFHPDWTSNIYNYGRSEVRSFLISSALFWLDKYHIDALRVDGVASMLYLDYSREDGEWIPNEDGSNENREAVTFLKQLNEAIYAEHPDTQTIAEESTAWPSVSRPTSSGGLGFGFKWDLGWMHDTLKYFERDPVHRKHHQDELTFRSIYAFSENYVLPLSHDEVVHGKGSLLSKMPGDKWQATANLRLILGYMYAQPGKKLLFMGGEFGMYKEWAADHSIDWHLAELPEHSGIQNWVRDLNHLYTGEPALHQHDADPKGVEWIDTTDRDNCILCFLRRGRQPERSVVIACNFTPVPRQNYRVGLPAGGPWHELLNSDAEHYGGSGQGNLGTVQASPTPWHGRPYSAIMNLPPLGCVFFQRELTP